MAFCIDSKPASGDHTDVHTTQMNPLGAVREFSDGNTYIYLKGATSTAADKVVVYQPGVWVGALAAQGLKGSVAIARATVDASTKFGWYLIIGSDTITAPSATASNVPLFIGGVSGQFDDTAVAGNQITNMFIRNAATANSAYVQINRAFVGLSTESTG